MTPVRLLKPHKYRAKAVTVDGHRFPSQAEAKRYGELRMLEKAGEIRNLRLQPWFVLMAPVYDGGSENINAGRLRGTTAVGSYRADFKYEKQVARGVWRWVVEDVKGLRTALYTWKKRHCEAQYDIEIVEITR